MDKQLETLVLYAQGFSIPYIIRKTRSLHVLFYVMQALIFKIALKSNRMKVEVTRLRNKLIKKVRREYEQFKKDDC